MIYIGIKPDLVSIGSFAIAWHGILTKIPVPLQTGIGLTYIRLTVDVIIHCDGYFHALWCWLQARMKILTSRVNLLYL
jgi:hypothetical protein